MTIEDHKQAAGGFVPAKLNRKQRRALRKRYDSAVAEIAPEQIETAEAEELPGRVIVGPGPFSEGVNGYWNPVPVAQPGHRTTSYNLGGIYPWLPELAPPQLGPVLGLDMLSGGLFALDVWLWYAAGLINSPNVVIIGGIGQGKSFFNKKWVRRSLVLGRKGICISDSKGEWGGFAIAVGGEVIKVGVGVCMNPLDRGANAVAADEEDVEAAILARRRQILAAIVDFVMPGRNTLANERTALDWALDEEIRRTEDNPTVGGVFGVLTDIREGTLTGRNVLQEESTSLWHSMRVLVDGELAGLFDGHSTVTLNPDSPLTVFDTESLAQRGELALALAQLVTADWVQNVISDKTSGRKYFLIREEGWREMGSLSALNRFRAQLKLSREYGTALLLILHKVQDFDAVGAADSQERALAYSILGDFENQIIFRQGPAALPLAQEKLGLTDQEAEVIRGLSTGVCVVRLREKFYVVDGTVDSTDTERRLFNTDNAMGDQTIANVVCAHCGSADVWNFCEQCGTKVAA